MSLVEFGYDSHSPLPHPMTSCPSLFVYSFTVWFYFWFKITPYVNSMDNTSVYPTVGDPPSRSPFSQALVNALFLYENMRCILLSIMSLLSGMSFICPIIFIFTRCIVQHLGYLLSPASRPCPFWMTWISGHAFSAHTVLVVLVVTAPVLQTSGSRRKYIGGWLFHTSCLCTFLLAQFLLAVFLVNHSSAAPPILGFLDFMACSFLSQHAPLTFLEVFPWFSTVGWFP